MATQQENFARLNEKKANKISSFKEKILGQLCKALEMVKEYF